MSLPKNILKYNGVWRDVGVLSIHDDHEDFYQHLPRPAPGASITTTLRMDGKDPGGGEKEGKVGAVEMRKSSIPHVPSPDHLHETV